jgi:hypothetical protein
MRAMIIALIVIAAVAVLLIMVVAGASGIYLPKKYHEAWNPGYFKQFNRDFPYQLVATWSSPFFRLGTNVYPLHPFVKPCSSPPSGP